MLVRGMVQPISQPYPLPIHSELLCILLLLPAFGYQDIMTQVWEFDKSLCISGQPKGRMVQLASHPLLYHYFLHLSTMYFPLPPPLGITVLLCYEFVYLAPMPSYPSTIQMRDSAAASLLHHCFLDHCFVLYYFFSLSLLPLPTFKVL